MIIRNGFIANSSSCTFIVYIGDMFQNTFDDISEELYQLTKGEFEPFSDEYLDHRDAISVSIDGLFMRIDGDEVYGVAYQIKEHLMTKYNVDEKYIYLR